MRAEVYRQGSNHQNKGRKEGRINMAATHTVGNKDCSKNVTLCTESIRFGVQAGDGAKTETQWRQMVDRCGMAGLK